MKFLLTLIVICVGAGFYYDYEFGEWSPDRKNEFITSELTTSERNKARKEVMKTGIFKDFKIEHDKKNQDVIFKAYFIKLPSKAIKQIKGNPELAKKNIVQALETGEEADKLRIILEKDIKFHYEYYDYKNRKLFKVTVTNKDLTNTSKTAARSQGYKVGFVFGRVFIVVLILFGIKSFLFPSSGRG